MTSDQLQQEAHSAVEKILNETASPLKYLFSPAAEIHSMMMQTYLAAAEPREKEIEELRTRVGKMSTDLLAYEYACVNHREQNDRLRAEIASLRAKLEAVPVDTIRALDEWELGLDYPDTSALSIWLAGLK